MLRLPSPLLLAALLACFPHPADASNTLPTALRGSYTIHLWPPASGPLTVQVLKRDLNIYAGKDELRVSLLTPTRSSAGAATIPDDGNTGKGGPFKVQSVTLSAPTTAHGAYRLRVTGCASSDCVFGVKTSAAGLVVEGPAPFLNDAALGGVVRFEPPAGAFTVKVMALHKPGCQTVTLKDALGKAQASLALCDASGKGVATYKSAAIPASAGDRSGPWALEVGKLDVRVDLGGAKGWTMAKGSLFAAHRARWMLLPYTNTRYLQPGGAATMTFTVRNSTGAAGPLAFKVSCPAGLTCAVQGGATSPLNLGAGARQDLRLKVALAPSAKAGATLTGALALTATKYQRVAQTAAIRVRVGISPVGKALKTPIVLRPYQHENYQFGYAPDHVRNEVHFDGKNRPFVRQRSESLYVTTALAVLESAGWAERSFTPALKAAYPSYSGVKYGGGFLGAKVGFVGQGGAYTLLAVTRKGMATQPVMLWTPDRGQSYQLSPFGGSAFDLEHFTGHNPLTDAPPLLAYTKTNSHPAPWCSYHDLQLYLPRRKGKSVTLGQPTLVSKDCLGSCQHSGGPGSLVSRAGKTHVVWGEVSKTGKEPGVPTYVATYHHATGKLGPKVFLAHGPPVDDVHNVPAITMDSKGTLHVVTGAHGKNFFHLSSVKPNDASKWSKPAKVLDAGYVDSTTDKDGEGRQTYISLVCDKQDRLHIAFRQWRRNADKHFPDRLYAALSTQTRLPGKAWGPARPLVIPPVAGYSIYYHKLTVDRQGRLFLSYNHWTSDTTYQGDFPERYHHRAVIMSADGGKTWKLVQTKDLAAGLLPPPKPDAGAPDLAAADAGQPDLPAADGRLPDGPTTRVEGGSPPDAPGSVTRDGPAAAPTDDGGCGCALPAGERGAGPGAALLLALIVLSLRRRKV